MGLAFPQACLRFRLQTREKGVCSFCRKPIKCRRGGEPAAFSGGIGCSMGRKRWCPLHHLGGREETGGVREGSGARPAVQPGPLTSEGGSLGEEAQAPAL